MTLLQMFKDQIRYEERHLLDLYNELDRAAKAENTPYTKIVISCIEDQHKIINRLIVTKIKIEKGDIENVEY